MNVSVKTAESKFKAAFGKTIHQYMLDFKIQEAMSYFDRFDEISVKEVAYNLGFCDEYLRLPLTVMEDAHKEVLFAEMRKLGINI